MKDVRMEVRRARMNQGVKYTALFSIDPELLRDQNPDDAFVSLCHLDGKRVTIENIGAGRYGYAIYTVEATAVALPHELSEWREE